MPRPRHTDPGPFTALAASCGIDQQAASTLRDELVARHAEPHRRYHTLDHVDAVLGHLERSASALDDRRAVALGAWYHDAVYDPTAAGNEAASAELATDRLLGAGADPALVADVDRLVRATAHHRPERPDEAALCDADLAVLAADPEGYERYRRAVREEYAHVDDGSWRRGRAAVLHDLLATDRLFATRAMADLEGAARANLAGELATLEAADR